MMHRSRLLAGTLACLLVTAGCLGVLGGESTSSPAESTISSPARTATQPSPLPETPTASPTRDAIPFPRRANRTWTESPGRFAATHDATLRNTSFSARYSLVRDRGGTVETRVVGIVRYDGDDTVYYNYTTDDPDSADLRRIVLWSNGTAARRAVTTPDGTVVEEARPVVDVRTFARQVNVYLRAFETSLTGYSQMGDEPVVRITSSTLDRADERSTVSGLAFQLDLEGIEGGTFSAVVEDDTLREYRVELVDRRPTDVITVSETLTITELGTTTVRRPDWVVGRNESQSG